MMGGAVGCRTTLFLGIGNIMEKDTTERLNELIASRRLLSSSRGPIWYIFPEMKHKIYMRYVYDSKLKECIANGIPTSEESIAEHKKLGLWDDLKDKNLERIPVFITETEEKIKKENNKGRKKKFQAWLGTLQREYVNLLNARNTIILTSAEYLANDAATFYMMWECLRNYDDSRIWKNFKDIEMCDDIAYVEELMNLFVKASAELTSSEIRKMARSSLWRVRWRAVEGDMTHLFGRSAQDLTNDQFLLVYWSQVYDSVYENMERPPDSIIEDDEELDVWLKEQSEKRDREVGQKFYGKSTVKGKKSKIDDASEVFKVVEGYFNDKGEFIRYSDEDRWNEIERIRNLNSPTARAIKKREEKILSKTPGVFIGENELRTRKEDREAMGGTVIYKRKK